MFLDFCLFMWRKFSFTLFDYSGFDCVFVSCLQAYYMELKKIEPEQSSFALTLLSFAECVTYIGASFVGDWFKGKLILTNVIAAGALAFICLFWPVVDINYGIILLISFCEYTQRPTPIVTPCQTQRQECCLLR